MTVFKAIFHNGTTYALHRRVETARISDRLCSGLALARATSESYRWAWPNSKCRLTLWLALGFELRRGASGALERVAGAARDSRTESAIRQTIDVAVSETFMPGLPRASAGKVTFPPGSPISRLPITRAGRAASPRDRHATKWRGPQRACLRFGARVAGGRGAARPLFCAGVAARKCGKGGLPPKVADTPAPFFSDPVPTCDRVIASLPAALRNRETARTVKLPDAAQASP